MSRYLDLDRRQFIRRSGLGGAFVWGVSLSPLGALLSPLAQAGKRSEADLFVSLDSDGTVHVTCHRSEMGQQIRTALAQVVADEMEADWNRIVVEQAVGDKRYGDQNTDGSKSVVRNLARLRQVGATVRAMLEQAAADNWDVDVASCRAELHEVVHSSGRRVGYGELRAGLAKQEAPSPEDVTLKTRDQWRYINRGMPTVDMMPILSGTAVYGADVRLDDTVVAVIARPPVFGGAIASYDAEAAKAVNGVIDVIEMPVPGQPPKFQPLGGVAVLASNTWAAMEGRRRLNASWKKGPNGDYDSSSYRRMLEAAADRPGDVHRQRGDVDKGLAESSKRVTSRYYTPHLTHASMEPPVATARFSEEGVEVWSACQNPQADQSTVAAMLDLPLAQVKINVALLGGAFGRKSKPDFSAEAAWLARHSGQTVRVQWTREDDIQHSYYHSVAAQRLDGGLDENGEILAFRHRSVFPTINSTFTAGAERPTNEANLGLNDAPLAAPNLQMETGRVKAHVRIGWMRSVANIYHAFAAQSFLCELAHSAEQDHRDFLLRAIGKDRLIDMKTEAPGYSNYGMSLEDYPCDTARHKRVLHRATDMAGWGRKLKAGRGLGLAVHRSFLSYVAIVVEVDVSDDGALTVPAVWVAIDAGTVVNPDSVRNQIQGAAVFGMSVALDAQITMEQGAVQQSNYHDYKVARMDMAPPRIDVEIVDSEAPPGGVGEPGTPPFAPALCNAIFAATGKRIRTLPIADQLKA